MPDIGQTLSHYRIVGKLRVDPTPARHPSVSALAITPPSTPAGAASPCRPATQHAPGAGSGRNWVRRCRHYRHGQSRGRPGDFVRSQAAARLHTSASVVIETFTFLDRQTTRDVAVAWRRSLARVPRLRVWPVTARDLDEAWAFFDRTDLHRLSAVDAVSFVLMRRAKIRTAFAFDHHFATVGFRLVG